MHDLVAEWSERIRAAAASASPLTIRGSGSKDFYGGPCHGTRLDTTACRGIVDYEPTELVLTARAGTTLAEIESALAVHGQMLAFEPPHFGPAATLGGTIACALSGPRRAAAGAARDFVLGVRLLDGRGRDLAFGGRVMKNVAGFDVSRLIVGALGTLGVLLEVSLKVLPQPEHEMTLRFEMDQQQAIAHLNEWAGKPHGISAACHDEGVLSIRLSGSTAGVQASGQTLGGEQTAAGPAFWLAVREQTADFFGGDDPLWRIALKPTAPVLPLPGRQLVEWTGALRWIKSDAEPSEVRRLATEAGGHATWFRGARDRNAVFQTLAEPAMRLHRRLKQTFDPAGILNRGRLYPDW